MKKLFVLTLALVFACSMAFASVGVRDQGVRTDSAMDLNFTGNVDIGDPYTAVQEVKIGERISEESATPDTIEVSESGTTFVATGVPTGSRSFDLPSITATTHDGVYFTFMTGVAKGGATPPDMNIEPQDDAIIFLSTSMAVGESITGSYADSYPVITLRAFGGDWYVESIKPGIGSGAWSNAG